MENTKEKALIRSKQKYGVISQNIMRHPLISTTAKSLYAYLAGFAGAENSAFPGRDLICYEMGLNKDTLTKYMWELQCWEIIQIEKSRGKGGKWEKNLYVLDHYPTFVMMDRKEFEEKIWPQLKETIKPEKKKASSKSTGKMDKSPCPKFSDTVKNDSPCPKLPDPVEPDPVQPDLVKPDTNNNILNNNSIKNNILNNNNVNQDKKQCPVSDPQDVVVDSAKINNSEENQQNLLSNRIPPTSKQIRDKFKVYGMHNLPEKVIKKLQQYSIDEISKVAVTLQKRKEQGKVKNPVGLISARPETIQSILAGEFYPDPAKPANKFDDINKPRSFGDEYHQLYIPPEVLEELKRKEIG